MFGFWLSLTQCTKEGWIRYRNWCCEDIAFWCATQKVSESWTVSLHVFFSHSRCVCHEEHSNFLNLFVCSLLDSVIPACSEPDIAYMLEFYVTSWFQNNCNAAFYRWPNPRYRHHHAFLLWRQMICCVVGRRFYHRDDRVHAAVPLLRTKTKYSHLWRDQIREKRSKNVRFIQQYTALNAEHKILWDCAACRYDRQ